MEIGETQTVAAPEIRSSADGAGIFLPIPYLYEQGISGEELGNYF